MAMYRGLGKMGRWVYGVFEDASERHCLVFIDIYIFQINTGFYLGTTRL